MNNELQNRAIELTRQNVSIIATDTTLQRNSDAVYAKWLHEKCEALLRVRARKQTKHLRQYRRNLEWRIRTLFSDDSKNSETYKSIIQQYGINPSEFCQN